MMAGSHAALGAAAWLVVAPHFGLSGSAALPLGLAVGGALLPDIDHPKSWVGRRLAPFSSLIARLLGHRGITHSLVAAGACAWLLHTRGLAPSLILPIVVGYLSHLAADLLTSGGLRLAWPLRGTWALPLCRTGSPFEPLVVATILLGAWCGMVGPKQLGEDLRAAGACHTGVGRLLFCAGAQPRTDQVP